MQIILKRAIYHAYSEQYKDVKIELLFNDEIVSVKAFFQGKEIYSFIGNKALFTLGTDQEVIDYIKERLRTDINNWIDNRKCDVLSKNIDTFSIILKESLYHLDVNGVDFSLKVKLNAKDLTMDMYMFNSFNSDVLQFTTKADNELDVTENVLIYAQTMQTIAQGFKKGQQILLQNNINTNQHLLENTI